MNLNDQNKARSAQDLERSDCSDTERASVLAQLARAASAEATATRDLLTAAAAAAGALVSALEPGQSAAGYQSLDGLLLGPSGDCVGDSRDSALAFARDVESGLPARMAHELRESARESARAAERLRQAASATGDRNAGVLGAQSPP
jgi:hypothetical protein